MSDVYYVNVWELPNGSTVNGFPATVRHHLDGRSLSPIPARRVGVLHVRLKSK